jgi:L-threonylcarbamoyladenylate synthase
MHTRLLPCANLEAVREAARILREGGLVAMPTETVYGLAANALDPAAVAEIFAVKGRPADNPLIVHIARLSMWEPLVEKLTEPALRLAKAFWPGPLTIVLPKRSLVPAATTAGLDTVAVRMPSHPCALAVIAECGLPLAAPSANLSGSPSPTSALHCKDDLWDKVPLILDGGPCEVGIESTVISLVGKPVVLRPGILSAEQLSDVLQEPVAVADAVLKPLAPGEVPASPGLKYRHYAPKARIILIEGSKDAFFRLLEQAPDGTFGLVFEGEENRTSRPCVVYGTRHDGADQAKRLFGALRNLDERGAKLVYARCPDSDGQSLGVYNRMLRAAAFEVRKV